MPPDSPCNPPPTWFRPRSGSPIHPRRSSSPARTQSPIPSPARSSFSGWSTEQRNRLMKTKKLFLLPALIVVLNLIPAGRLMAQTFTTLHSFTALPDPDYTNSDGANPHAGLILSGNTLYWTAD